MSCVCLHTLMMYTKKMNRTVAKSAGGHRAQLWKMCEICPTRIARATNKGGGWWLGFEVMYKNPLSVLSVKIIFFNNKCYLGLMRWRQTNSQNITSYCTLKVRSVIMALCYSSQSRRTTLDLHCVFMMWPALPPLLVTKVLHLLHLAGISVCMFVYVYLTCPLSKHKHRRYTKL